MKSQRSEAFWNIRSRSLPVNSRLPASLITWAVAIIIEVSVAIFLIFKITTDA